MKLISHRGNLDKKSKLENHPEQIERVINLGFDCEIDVSYICDKYFLGHDSPQYEIDESFLENKNIWCHAKNLAAFEKMLQNKNIHCFWHENDSFTLTSQKIIWTYPNNPLTNLSICVLPELGYNGDLENCYGICSDEIIKYQNICKY